MPCRGRPTSIAVVNLPVARFLLPQVGTCVCMCSSGAQRMCACVCVCVCVCVGWVYALCVCCVCVHARALCVVGGDECFVLELYKTNERRRKEHFKLIFTLPWLRDTHRRDPVGLADACPKPRHCATQSATIRVVFHQRHRTPYMDTCSREGMIIVFDLGRKSPLVQSHQSHSYCGMSCRPEEGCVCMCV